eukprot:3938342-Rhodomonas_salina.1
MSSLQKDPCPPETLEDECPNGMMIGDEGLTRSVIPFCSEPQMYIKRLTQSIQSFKDLRKWREVGSRMLSELPIVSVYNASAGDTFVAAVR